MMSDKLTPLRDFVEKRLPLREEKRKIAEQELEENQFSYFRCHALPLFILFFASSFSSYPYTELEDPKGICEDILERGSWGTGDVRIGVGEEKEIDYALKMITQSYNYYSQ